MNINNSTNNSVNLYNNNALNNQERKNSTLVKLQKRVVALDMQIAGIKENEQLSALEKKERINQLEEQKKELMIKVQEEKLKEKMNEVEEKIEEAEEIEAKRKEKENKPPTPLEEIKAELGMDEIPSKMMIKASKALDTANEKFGIARKLRQDAKILDKQVETDRGRGQGVESTDFRIEQSITFRTKADQVEEEAMEALGKANKLVKKAGEKIKKTTEENNDIKEDVREEDREEMVQDDIKNTDQKKLMNKKNEEILGQNVDVRL